MVAHRVTADLMSLGYLPFCPHTNFAFIEQVSSLTYEDVMKACLQMIAWSDAVYMIRGWEKSTGASREREWARDLNLPIFYNLHQAQKWLRRAK